MICNIYILLLVLPSVINIPNRESILLLLSKFFLIEQNARMSYEFRAQMRRQKRIINYIFSTRFHKRYAILQFRRPRIADQLIHSTHDCKAQADRVEWWPSHFDELYHLRLFEAGSIQTHRRGPREMFTSPWILSHRRQKARSSVPLTSVEDHSELRALRSFQDF